MQLQSRWLLACAAVVAGRSATAQTYEWLSQKPGGGSANGACGAFPPGAVLSSDGRFVAFDSAASDLVAADTDAFTDTYVLDRLTNTLDLVSVWGAGATTNSTGTQVGGISDDGNWVAFLSWGLNPADLDDSADVCLRDRTSGVTIEISPNHSLAGVFSISTAPQISADGRYIAFEESEAAWATRAYAWDRIAGAFVWARTGTNTNWIGASLVDDLSLARQGAWVTYLFAYLDGNFSWQRELRRAPLTGGGVEQVFFSTSSANLRNQLLSADGRYCVYTNQNKLWLHDASSGLTERLDPTLDGTGLSAVQASYATSISDDGRRVAFISNSSKFVAGDTNGLADAFVRDRLTQRTLRASVDAAGGQLASETRTISLVGDGSAACFVNAANGLVAGDTNGFADVFRRVLYGLDGGAYCASTTVPGGCTPTISAAGAPSVSQASGYTVTVAQLPGQRNGLMFYGAAPQATPFSSGHPSTLCVSVPRQRTDIASSGGSAGACDGVLALDILSWAAAHPGALLTPLAAGQVMCFQGWFRESSLQPASALSNAWTVTLSY